jgi:hypothetical protein
MHRETVTVSALSATAETLDFRVFIELVQSNFLLIATFLLHLFL